MKNRSFMTILAVTVITAVLAAGCGSSNTAPAKEEAATETVQATAEEANPADELWRLRRKKRQKLNRLKS